MNRLAFFDTNILVYADDDSVSQKQARAIQLVTEHRRSGLLVVSVQVMQEYFATATRKLGVAPELAQRKVEILARGLVVRLEPEDVAAAIELHRLTRGLSFWDALIVHAARLAGAATLYSEDFQHGATLAGVRVLNPFLDPLP